MAHIKPLPEELQKIAIEELGEVPSRIPEDLQALKSWIQQQPHLRARTDDQFLIQFLRGCKYSLERAKEKIDVFFSLKSKYPGMFGATDVDEPKFRTIHNLGSFAFLPKPLNETGPRIVVFQFNYTSDKYSIEDVYYSSSALFELMMLNDPYACIQGLVYIIDFAKVSAGHFLQLTPNFCKKLASFLEKSTPARIRAIYYINIPTAAQKFFQLLFPLFSEKLRQRLHLLGRDIKELVLHIPMAYLPQDYGGENGLCSDITEQDNTTLDLYRDYFKENANYATDESLRTGRPLDLDGLFGVGGSFRKLAVD